MPASIDPRKLRTLFLLAFSFKHAIAQPLAKMGGIYDKVPEGLEEIDVIIAGGKTTAFSMTTVKLTVSRWHSGLCCSWTAERCQPGAVHSGSGTGAKQPE